ncbi:MAG: DedA family protein [Frankia sp.]
MRRAGRIDAVCLGGLLTQSVWGVVAAFFIPSLVGTHPILLEAFTSSTPAMVAGGAFVRVGRATWTPALLAPVIGWVPLDVFGWWAGRRYGRAAVDVIVRQRPRTARFAARADRLTSRFGVWALVLVLWLPLPNQLVYAATGWAGMRLRTFLLWDTIGTLIRAGIIVGLGYALGNDAVEVATTISHYALVCVAVGTVLALGWVLLARRIRLRAQAMAALVVDSTEGPRSVVLAAAAATNEATETVAAPVTADADLARG